jgi:PTS system nitrogen regulatory IIA component
MLEQTLSTHRIDLDVDASSKKRVLEKVVDLCAQDENKQDWFLSLIEREKLGSTGLGHGVALPHARIANIEEPTACFIRLETPIDFGSPDGEPVDLIFGLFVPEESNDTHLQILASVAERFNSEKVRKALRETNSAESVYTILTDRHKGAALAS